ncbi:MAG TPA: Clp1/GlmU family protein [Actinomycetota bacterium]|nr:Clp1/GlmU family protein [Actinomycetota bacterium]
MSDIEQAHADAVAELVASPGRVFVTGGIDSGKTTFVLRLARAAVEAGIPTAVIDADLAQSTIGPPATVGLKLFRSVEDLDPASLGSPDAMAFVGTVSPRGKLLPLVTGTAKLVLRAIEMGARMTVVDTSGLIGGVAGQLLKLHKAELCRPHHVVALARGGEMEPVTGVLRKFLSLHVMELEVHPEIRIRPVDERLAYQERRLGEFLGPQVHRWRVKPTVFMPSLPPDFDLATLEGLLVGVDNGHGDCLGLGVLEHRDQTLRLLTPVAEGVKALRLGSVRATARGTITGRVDIPAMFGTD